MALVCCVETMQYIRSTEFKWFSSNLKASFLIDWGTFSSTLILATITTSALIVVIIYFEILFPGCCIKSLHWFILVSSWFVSKYNPILVSKVRFVFLVRISLLHFTMLFYLYQSLSQSQVLLCQTSLQYLSIWPGCLCLHLAFIYYDKFFQLCFLTFTWHWFSLLLSSYWTWRELSTHRAKCYLSLADWQKAHCLKAPRHYDLQSKVQPLNLLTAYTFMVWLMIWSYLRNSIFFISSFQVIILVRQIIGFPNI